MKTRQRGHADYSAIFTLLTIVGGAAVVGGLGLIVIGAWLVWDGARILGWR